MAITEPLCITCKHPKDKHLFSGTPGLYKCPISTYYTPCPHLRTHGWGTISQAGSAEGESWCDDCGAQVAFTTVANPLGVRP